MRDLFKTVMTSSMVAGAALLVAACGGGEEAATDNAVMTDVGTDPMMEGTTNDVTAVDGALGADDNMAMDTNMTMDANMGATDMNMMNTGTDANMTNGM